jgi:hypothetical protein
LMIVACYSTRILFFLALLSVIGGQRHEDVNTFLMASTYLHYESITGHNPPHLVGPFITYKLLSLGK